MRVWGLTDFGKNTEFKEKRDYEKFHEPKNIAMSISIEASKLEDSIEALIREKISI